MKRVLFLVLWILPQVQSAYADIDESAYEAVGAVRNEQKRQRLQAQFAAEAEAERRRAEEEAARAQRERDEANAREAARPYPERLTKQQCTLCHPAENYTEKRHVWLYWRLVVARMAWLNGAPVAPEEQGVIASHLAAAYPARVQEYAIEYGGPPAALALLAAAVRLGKRLWAKFRRKQE